MDLQLDSLSRARRDKLNAELEKADAYLKALTLADSKRRIEILNELAASQESGANRDTPESRLLAELFERIDQWAAQNGMTRDEAVLAAWLGGSADGGREEFLKNQRSSSRALLSHGPELALSRMTARPMDFGVFPAIARDTRKSLEWLPLLRAIVFWALVYLAIVFGYPRLFPG